jgi:Mg2+ and Co2+ transporter CorA
MSDPYWIHGLFVEELVHLQDDAVWGIRNLVRNIEVNRATSAAPNPNYPALHDTARHAIHISETLDTGIKTINMMVSGHDQFLADRENADRSSKKTGRKIQKRISFHHHMLSSLQSRSISTKERLLNEIQLAYNLVAQYDSQISVEIGRAARSDSAAMKTIAFLTLTFFPATFISAIFSMSFFNYNPESDKWTVSKKFWVYWVVAIPITCITALMWSSWHKLFPMKQIGDRPLQPRGKYMIKNRMQVMATNL